MSYQTRVVRFLCWFMIGCAVFVYRQNTGAQEADKESDKETAPADSSLQREYARLAQLLNSDDTFGRREAAETLLRVRPNDVANPETRKLIARGYRTLALEGRIGQDEAIRGLIIWGGKYSVPTLLEIMDKSKMSISDEIFVGLGQLKDPKGAEAVATQLGNFFNHDEAVRSLRRMGSTAEDILIQKAPSTELKVSLAAVQLLGDIGSEKSLPVLQKAMQARNAEIKIAARDSIKRIRDRQRAGESVDKAASDDSDSPFNATAGPPVDITAKNTRTFPDISTRPRRGRGAAAAEASDVPPADQGDWSQVQPLLPGEPAGAGVSPDPAPANPEATWRPQPVRLGAAAGHFERAAALTLGGKTPGGLVLYSDPSQKSFSRLEALDLRQRRVVARSNIVGSGTLCRLSPSGSRLLVISQDGLHDRKARVTVYGLAAGKTTEQATWWPYASADHWQNAMPGAEWIDDDRLLTINSWGMLVVWRLDGKTPRAIYQIDGDDYSSAALSPGRAQFAFATSRGMEIFRAEDGELLARMSESRGASGTPVFNAKGDRLAAVSGKRIYVWNTTTGDLEREFDCSNLAGGGSLDWLDDSHLLVGGTDVVDIERRLLLWRYELSGGLSQYDYGRLWVVTTVGNGRGLMPVQLMQPEVLATAEKLNADEILALKPGAKVSLEVALGGEQHAKGDAALRAAVTKSGMTVEDGQPIRIRAQMVTGNSATQQYGRTMLSDNRESATVTEQRYEVELLIDGQSAWKQSSVLQSAHAPSMVFKKEGESAQQAIDRENQQRMAGYQFGVTLPRYVVHPKYAGPLGTSKITPSGVE